MTTALADPLSRHDINSTNGSNELAIAPVIRALDVPSR